MADFQVRAVTKYIMGSPIKMRRVTSAVRGMQAEEALQVLKLMPHKAAREVYKTVASALANAEQNYGLSPEDMRIAEIMADSGPTLKRGRFGARGRYKPVRKRTSHITVILEEVEEY